MTRRTDAPSGRARNRRPTDPHLRIGDVERNQVADALSRHFSDGRIDEVELKERLDQAMAAKTGADLEGILSDLPSLPGDDPAPLGPVRHRGGALWLVLTVVFLASLTPPFRVGTWMWFPHVPWVLFDIVAVLIWRRSHRHRWRQGTGA